MAEVTGRDFCIFENEYAQADIDKSILLENSNLNIWELTENCICCSGKQDFAATILTISNTIDPDFLIVEPTGVAKLSSIINNIKKISYERISLLETVTIADGICLLENHLSDIFIDQIKSSKEIIVTKLEKSDEDEKNKVREIIHNINPDVENIEFNYKLKDKDFYMKFLNNNAEVSNCLETKTKEQYENNRIY